MNDNERALKYASGLGKAARKTLENIADELNIHGEQRKEMMRCTPIVIQGKGFCDVYGNDRT